MAQVRGRESDKKSIIMDVPNSRLLGKVLASELEHIPRFVRPALRKGWDDQVKMEIIRLTTMVVRVLAKCPHPPT